MKASMKVSLLMVGLALAGIDFSASAQSNARGAIAETQHVTQANEIAARLAIIKSAEDLSAYIAQIPPQYSPLSDLSPAAKKRFLSSLQFGEKGIASFSYADLEVELTPSQIYRLLSLFGVQRTVPLIKGARVADDTDRMIMSQPSRRQCLGGNQSNQSACDHEGYRCVGVGTCAQAMSMICTSNCRG